MPRARRLLGAAVLAALAAVALIASGRGPGGSGPAELVGRVEWRLPWRGFGGYSAIELSADGREAVILSDRTAFVTARLRRDARGAVTAVEDASAVMLTDARGEGLRDREADSEGLAIAEDGTVYEGFEGDTRVRREGTPPVTLPGHPDFARFRTNLSIEALAVDADGTLYALAEEGPRSGASQPVYRYRDGRWDVAFGLRRRAGFAVTGADVGPDGRLYVLERAFWGVGFRTRVRRVGLDGRGEEVLLTTPIGRHDNLEGLAAWHDGRWLRLTLISDDNFRAVQRTEIVDYRLPD